MSGTMYMPACLVLRSSVALQCVTSTQYALAQASASTTPSMTTRPIRSGNLVQLSVQALPIHGLATYMLARYWPMTVPYEKP